MEAVLASSLAAASKEAESNPDEKVFHVSHHVFLGTKFGAADRGALDALKVRAVINMTAGATRVPNYFAGSGIEYLHLELTDELISNPSQAIPGAYRALHRWGKDGTRVIVHCSAGLSRSVTAVLAWLMRDQGHSLKTARDLVEQQRGRRLKCNPSFWCYLSALEREINGWPPGTPPSVDWSGRLAEDMARMGMGQKESRIVDALQNTADWVDFWSFYTHLSGHGIKHLVAAQRIAQQPLPETKAACRAASFTLEIMEVYHALPAFQAYALRVVQPLLCHPDARVRQHVFAGGLLGKTLGAMGAHAGDVQVQEAGCAALAYLAHASPNCCEEVLTLGGADVVLACMRSHLRVVQIQTTACICLAILLSGAAGRERPFFGAAAEALVGAMRAHPADAKVQGFAISGLQALAKVVPAGAEALVASGTAASAVRDAMQRHPEQRTQGAQLLQALEPFEAEGCRAEAGALAPAKAGPFEDASPELSRSSAERLPGA